jgi:uncharacterized protein (DUF849 family)
VLAKTNAEQVALVRRILADMSIDVATPDDARDMLRLKGPGQVSYQTGPFMCWS